QPGLILSELDHCLLLRAALIVQEADKKQPTAVSSRVNLMKVTWSQLTPSLFEKLCSLILEQLEFTDIEWYGKSGGDKGRDLTAKKEESPLPSSKRMTKW